MGERGDGRKILSRKLAGGDKAVRLTKLDATEKKKIKVEGEATL